MQFYNARNIVHCGSSLLLVALFGYRGSTPEVSVQMGDSPQVAIQPFAQQVRHLELALNYLGQPLPKDTQHAIDQAIAVADEAQAVSALQSALDPYILAAVDINSESRVKVTRGPAEAVLVQGGARFFLVKVINRAGVTAPLNVSSPNSGKVYVRAGPLNSPTPKQTLTPADVRDRWAELSIYSAPPMDARLSGLGIEYRVLQVTSRDAGDRSADISFDVGQGSQDIGFRNDILVLFHIAPAHAIRLHITDEKGMPTIASLTIRDRWDRLYPSPIKRLAPDLFFQPQIYRADGETIDLPPGRYTIQSTGGPEYSAQTAVVIVTADSPKVLSFHLHRWIDPSQSGWYSGDDHIHAAGCAHYSNPTEGVDPKDMIRQIEGEKLNVGSVLTWGPDYYYQKQFFSSHDDSHSLRNVRMHYDLEVSGFPSSHAGHIVLLGLKDQNYPGTKKIEDWPSWDLPILQWAHRQGAVTGFPHSGIGLAVNDDNVPSFIMPGFDGVGANEYIVDVTEPDAVDFVSAGNTPYVSELSIWYHTLNVGFRTRLSGETDFPCITDERVGHGRVYVKIADHLTFDAWLVGLKAGRSYVSDGRTHLMDFTVNGVEAGTKGSEIRLKHPAVIHASVRVAALLDVVPDLRIKSLPYDQKPYWTIERARIGATNLVPVELVVNGKAVEHRNIAADGAIHHLAFHVPIAQSSWVAMRILPAAHTNPVFVLVGGRPIRASRASAEWCRAAVHQCWTQKASKITPAERPAAEGAYEHADAVYLRLANESAR